MALSDKALGQKVSTTPAVIPDTSVALTGEYVTLIGLTEEHVPSLFKNLRFSENSHLLDYFPMELPASENELWEQLKYVKQHRGFYMYAILADPDHVNPIPRSAPSSNKERREETVGMIGYLNVVPEHRTLEVGAVLFSPILGRSTAATEAHYLFLRNVLEENSPGLGGSSPPYRRIEWKCNHLNQKSRRAADRLGYVFEGTWRKHWIVKGRTRDSDWLSIIDDDWPTVKTALEQWLKKENFDQEGRQIRTIDEIRASVK